MITGTILKNGTIKLILTGSDLIDEATLKALEGATVSVIPDNYKLGGKLVSNGLIVTQHAQQVSIPSEEKVLGPADAYDKEREDKKAV